MSIYEPIFLSEAVIDPQSINSIIPDSINGLSVRVYSQGEAIDLSDQSSAKLLLTLYSNKYLQGELPDWMLDNINQLSKDSKLEILRQQGQWDEMNPLDLDAESARLCNQIETEVNEPVEVCESELQQTDINYNDMPF